MELIISQQINKVINAVEGPNFNPGECYLVELRANELDSVKYNYINNEWVLEYVIGGNTVNMNSVNYISANGLLNAYKSKFNIPIYEIIACIEGEIIFYFIKS